MKNENGIISNAYFLIPFIGEFYRFIIFPLSRSGHLWFQHYSSILGFVLWMIVDKNPRKLLFYLLVVIYVSGANVVAL